MTDNGFGENEVSLAEHDGSEEQPQRIQEDKINKKKLQELEPNGKMLQFFTKVSKSSPMMPCNAFKDVPEQAATICSNLLYDHIVVKKNTYYTITGAFDLEAYQFVFNWIKVCAVEQNVANMPDVAEMLNEHTGFNPLIEIMLAAQKLRIPKASFNKFLLRKMGPLTKEYLVDLDIVRRAFDTGDEEFADLELRDLCVESIFKHWYDYKLEGEDKADYMVELAELRENIPELDQALRDAVKDKDAFLTKRREDRKNADAADAGGGDQEGFGLAADGDTNGITQDYGAAAGADDAWASAAPQQPADWEAGGVAADTAAGGSNWADSMNDNDFANSGQQFNPIAVTAGGGW